MARGKYAQRAADKRAELEVTTDLASYQHRVARLTAENRELRETLDSERAAHRKVERRLRAERDEAVGPQVEAMRLAMKAEQTKHIERLRSVARFVGEMIDVHEWGLTSNEWTHLAALLGNVPELMTPTGGGTNRTQRRATPKRVRHALEMANTGRVPDDGPRVGPPPANRKDADW